MQYGPDGAYYVGIDYNTNNYSATRYRVSFKRPIQPTDTLILEHYRGSEWVPISNTDVCLNTYQGDYIYGVGISPTDTSTPTDIYVSFGNGGRLPLNSTYATAGAPIQAWLANSGLRWRLRKVSNGNMAEQPRMVRAEYNTSSGQTVDTASTVINFDNKVEDTHNAVTTGVNWEFTVPMDGVYHITSGLLFAHRTWATGVYASTGLQTNYVRSHNLSRVAGPNFTDYLDVPAKAVSSRFVKGDKLRIDSSCPASATNLHSDSTYNWITIERIGN